ncbi:hypothetical protein BaRGS_00037345 [Batillaria attramentaria]|uniref:Uncharacterized protein n=1 Tax=Batillaria attramentaria TaxID=370345 RepID=A0ABD0J8Z3_9CAEN
MESCSNLSGPDFKTVEESSRLIQRRNKSEASLQTATPVTDTTQCANPVRMRSLHRHKHTSTFSRLSKRFAVQVIYQQTDDTHAD